MEYALIENGIVVNLIYLHPMNVSEFPNAVPINDLSINIGDTYHDGKFYRNEEEIEIKIDAIAVYQTGYDQAVLDMIAQGVL